MTLVDAKTVRFVFEGIAEQCKPLLVSEKEKTANPGVGDQETVAIGKLIALYARMDKALLLWLTAMAAEECNLKEASANTLKKLEALPEQPNFDVLLSKPDPSKEHSGNLIIAALEAIDQLVDEDWQLALQSGATPSDSLGRDKCDRLAGLIATHTEWEFDEVSLIFSEAFYFCNDPRLGEMVFELGFEDVTAA